MSTDVTLSDSLLNGYGQNKGGVVQGQRLNLTALTVDNQQSVDNGLFNSIENGWN